MSRRSSDLCDYTCLAYHRPMLSNLSWSRNRNNAIQAASIGQAAKNNSTIAGAPALLARLDALTQMSL